MKPEIKTNMDFKDYADVKACHKSALKHVQTAKHLDQFESKPVDTDALRFGKIFHEALFDPKFCESLECYSEQHWIPKSDHPEKISINDQKATWKQDRELYFLNETERESLELMVKSIHSNELAKKFLHKAEVEPSLFWVDQRTGLPCKTRLDLLLDDDIIVEIKSDADPSPEAFGRKIYNMGYHVGAWFNREGFRAVFGRDLKAFIFIVVEKSPPHAVAVYMMNAHDFEAGELDGVSLMMRYKHIKAGGLRDYNHTEGGAYSVLPVQTPNWVHFKLDGDGDIDAPEPESEGGQL
jgi:hypothetical protein